MAKYRGTKQVRVGKVERFAQELERQAGALEAAAAAHQENFNYERQVASALAAHTYRDIIAQMRKEFEL